LGFSDDGRGVDTLKTGEVRVVDMSQQPTVRSQRSFADHRKALALRIAQMVRAGKVPADVTG
jgi:hypothetical protein